MKVEFEVYIDIGGLRLNFKFSVIGYLIGVKFEHFLGLPNIDYQLWFKKYGPIILFLSGPFLPFIGPWELFLELGLGSKNFGTYLHKVTTFVLDV